VKNPVVRLNTSSGCTESFATNFDRWIHHPDGDDLSAYQLDVSAKDHNQAWIWEHAFLTREIMNQYLGLGSDVAMLGRFIGLNGLISNTPVARFGFIAAPETIQEANTFQANQETFVIDCQSLPGYSGSPIVAYLPTTTLHEAPVENPGLGPWLLGVDWKHFGNREYVLNKDGERPEEQPYIKGNSGLLGAIPAWRIPRLLQEFPETITGSFVRSSTD
jgi:hypothetical protein